MQTRPYPERSGRKVWLNREEQELLLDWWEEDYPVRRIALWFGLHGLRSDEITQIEYRHFEKLGQSEKWGFVVPDGKTGRRRPPCDTRLKDQVRYYKNMSGVRKDEPLIDVATRTMRSWMSQLREELEEHTGDKRYQYLTLHDLRSTWATDTYYTLAFAGTPIAEDLTMSWGGWAKTETGRTTFRTNYLGPIPDHIAASAMDTLPYE